jgi:hypothetical protein
MLATPMVAVVVVLPLPLPLLQSFELAAAGDPGSHRHIAVL